MGTHGEVQNSKSYDYNGRNAEGATNNQRDGGKILFETVIDTDIETDVQTYEIY